MSKVLKIGSFRLLLPILMAGVISFAPGVLTGQSVPPAAGAQPDQGMPGGGVAPKAATASAGPSVDAKEATPASAAAQIVAALERLKAEGNLSSSRAVSAAVHSVAQHNSIQHDLTAPTGAKVIAVHKHPGEIVRVGDKIVTLEVDGKPMTILAKQSGIMQTLNVSKGGVIGNTRPRAARVGTEAPGIDLILISPITLSNI